MINLMTIINSTNFPTDFVVMELGVASSYKSNIVVGKVHPSRPITKSVKSKEERQDAKSKFNLACIIFLRKASTKIKSYA